MYPTKLIDLFLEKIHRESNTGTLSPTRVLHYLNLAQKEVAAAFCVLGKNYCLKSSSINQVSGQGDYDLPRDFLRMKDCKAGLAGDSKRFFMKPMPLVRVREVQEAYANYALAGWGRLYAVENGDTLVLAPKPSSSISNNIQVRYYSRPPDMFYANFDAYFGGSDVTFQVDDVGTASSWYGTVEYLGAGYDGLKIYVSSGTAKGEEGTISSLSLSGDTVTITLESALGTSMVADDVVEIVSILPPAAREALIAHAAYLWAVENNAPDQAQRHGQAVVGELGAPISQLRSKFEKWQSQESRRIRRVW